MHKTAFAVGQQAAFSQFGLAKTALNARLVGSLAGAGLGAMVAPEGDRLQGAVLGGTAGYVGGAGASRAVQGGKRALRWAADRLAPSPHIPSQEAMRAAMGNPASAKRAMPTGPTPVSTVPPGYPAPATRAMPTGPTPVPTAPVGAPVPKVAGEFGVGMRAHIPGTPLGLNVGGAAVRERLPGMHRWVPREYIERAYEGLEQGLDAEAILERENARGTLSGPLAGAGAGAALAHFGLPSSGGTGAALGALGGAGLGALLNRMTSGQRRQYMAEALHGVAHEQQALSGRSHEHTANEPRPLLMARSGGGES